MNRILKSYIYWTYPRGNFHRCGVMKMNARISVTITS